MVEIDCHGQNEPKMVEIDCFTKMVEMNLKWLK